MGLELRSDGRFWYQPTRWGEEMFIRDMPNNQILVYDESNSFEMVFHKDDIDVAIDVITKIAKRELQSVKVQDYKPMFSHYMGSNNIDRLRAMYVVEMIDMFYNPLKDLKDIDNINEVLNKSSLYRLVVIHDAVEKKRKEKAQCLEQSLKELVN